MTTIPRKQKRLYMVSPITVLAPTTIMAVFLILWLLAGSPYSVSGNIPGTFGNTGVVNGDVAVSFAGDVQFWDANCSHGWSANESCDAIVARANYCGLDLNSPYCMEYDAYMKQIHFGK